MTPRAGGTGQGPRHHLRHHLARRRAVARRLDDPPREAAGRRDPRRDGRRRHRGRLPDRLQRRFRVGRRDRQGHQERRRLRSRARRLQGHRPRGRGLAARRAAAHPHLHLDQPAPHEVQAEHGAGGGLRGGHRLGDAGAQLYRRRRMVAGGRHPHRARFPLPHGRSGDQGRRHHHQHPRHRRLHGAGGILRAHPHADGARAQCRQGGVLDPLPQRPRPGGRQFAGRRARPARGRSNAPSTASASAPATPRWKRW